MLQQRAGESMRQEALTLVTLQELSTALEELHVASPCPGVRHYETYETESVSPRSPRISQEFMD